MASTITRDSGNIPFLFEYQQELFICSSNGSIRTYALTHSGQNIKMVSYANTRSFVTTLLFSYYLNLMYYCLRYIVCMLDNVNDIYVTT